MKRYSLISTLLIYCTLLTHAQIFTSEVKVVDTENKVGIGTLTPDEKLEVSGNIRLGLSGQANKLFFSRPLDGNIGGYIGYTSSTSNAEFRIQTSSGQGYITFFSNDGSATAERARIAGNGYFGIGTTNPGVPLEVAGSIWATNGGLISKLGSNNRVLMSYTSDNGIIYVYDNSNNINQRFFAGGDSYILNNNFGLGTSSPSYKLHVTSTSGDVIAEFNKSGSGAQNSTVRIASNSTAGLTFGHQNFFKEAYINHSYSSATHLLFKVRSSTHMAITDAGNVGIGTTSPSYKLQVEGTVRATTFSAANPPWSDFVFGLDYKLPSLEYLEAYILENMHLPDIPTQEEVAKKGVDLVKMNALLLQKVEELTVHIIELNKRMEKLENNNKE